MNKIENQLISNIREFGNYLVAEEVRIDNEFKRQGAGGPDSDALNAEFELISKALIKFNNLFAADIANLSRRPETNFERR